jgi:CRP/FNR family transcriptional regulator, cyclic AMP receptor protein
MDTPSVVELLRATPLFRNLDSAALVRLAERSVQRGYRRGQFIFYLDEPGDSLVVLVSGTLELTVLSPSGEELLLEVLNEPGAIVGELSVIDGARREVSCEALTNSTVLRIAREDFLRLLREEAAVTDELLRWLATRIRQLTELSSDLAYLSIRGRLAKVLLSMSQHPTDDGEPDRVVSLQVSQGDLARMTGGSRVSINRALRAWEQRGIVRIGHREITLLDPQYLRRLSVR